MPTLPATAASNPRGRGSVQALIPGRGVRALVTAVPIVVPVGMRALFPVLARRLGTRRGHLTGFAVYWTVCYLLPLGLLGRTRVRALLRQPARPLPSPRWLAAAALLVPPLGAAGSELAPELGNADPAVVATAAGVAVVNAAGEELLWRGLFVATFPDDPVRGWLWPAVGFTAWHLAPLAVLPPRRRDTGVPGPDRADRGRVGVGGVADTVVTLDPAASCRHRRQRAAGRPLVAGPLTPTGQLGGVWLRPGMGIGMSQAKASGTQESEQQLLIPAGCGWSRPGQWRLHFAMNPSCWSGSPSGRTPIPLLRLSPAGESWRRPAAAHQENRAADPEGGASAQLASAASRNVRPVDRQAGFCSNSIQIAQAADLGAVVGIVVEASSEGNGLRSGLVLPVADGPGPTGRTPLLRRRFHP